MTDLQIQRKVNAIFSAKPNGREKGYLESIYWGVGKEPYAYLSDCKAAKIKISKKRVSPSGAWYYVNKTEAKKLIKYLTR